jgi:CheY-like chemotaxis protein
MPAPNRSAGRATTIDWSGTDLGDRALWPPTLRLCVDILLDAPSPMLLAWGPRKIALFNDAYAALAGAACPPVPGAVAQARTPAPLAAAPEAYLRALHGEPQCVVRQRLDLQAASPSEPHEFDLHLTPIRDAQDQVAGVLYQLARSSAAAVEPASAGLRVLVVEDNLDSQYLVCEMLKAFGHEADGVGHAEGALDKLAAARYDVLFSDVSLPGMSGVELARQAVRTDPALHVIFASGYGDTLLRHLDFPFQSLQKPYEIEQLQAALSGIAAQHGTPSV